MAISLGRGIDVMTSGPSLMIKAKVIGHGSKDKATRAKVKVTRS